MAASVDDMHFFSSLLLYIFDEYSDFADKCKTNPNYVSGLY